MLFSAIRDDVVAALFDVEGLMASLTGGEPLYCCGPLPMIESRDRDREAARLGAGAACTSRFSRLGATADRRHAVRGGVEEHGRKLHCAGSARPYLRS